MAMMPTINTNRRNMNDPTPPECAIIGFKSGIFKPDRPGSPQPTGRPPYSLRPNGPLRMRGETIGTARNGIHAAATDRGIRHRGSKARAWRGVCAMGHGSQSVDRGHSTSTPPPGGAADWQPGAILRMPFSERLCRNGGIVCGQALMAFADTAMVIANLAANRGYRPMTTVDQTTHFMRAVTSSDVLADARVVRLGRTMSFGRVTLLERRRQQAGGDGLERVRDAVRFAASPVGKRKAERRVSRSRAVSDSDCPQSARRARFWPRSMDTTMSDESPNRTGTGAQGRAHRVSAAAASRLHGAQSVRQPARGSTSPARSACRQSSCW